MNVSFIPFLVTFGDRVMKILRNICLHFARQDGQDKKKWRENLAKMRENDQNNKTKRRKDGMGSFVISLFFLK